MSQHEPRVLDVGQCDFDHGNIGKMLVEQFGAVVDRAHNTDEAIKAISKNRYDIVMVNRIFDADGAEGTELIKKLQADESNRRTTVMLVSNYADAQDAAVALGAKRGFGKDAISDPATIQCLAAFLRPTDLST
ncbi:MAG: response regulator [Planctomycetes bacterium]|nr:response regulator [Planctomycetota bacterium]